MTEDSTLKLMRQTIDQMVEQIGSLTSSVSRLDAARMAHRHLLANVLSKVPAKEVNRVVADLEKGLDEAEAEIGDTHAMGYRSELDAIQAQAKTARRG